jgi:hypothetical protein
MPRLADAAATRRALAGLVLAAAVAACSPTVKVQAPDKPIEINLNVRIEQEVRVKIDRELESAFQENDDIF